MKINKSFKNISRKLEVVGTREERNYFLENLSLLVVAGISIVPAINSLQEELKSKALKKRVKEIAMSIESGKPIWKALDEATLFPPYAVALIKVGEQSGTLSKNLEILSETQRRDHDLRSEVKSALMYPVFVLAVTLVIGLGIAWFILPRLANVFSRLNTELPTMTKVLIRTGEIIGNYGVYIVPGVLLGLMLIIYLLFFNSKTKKSGQFLLMHTPGFKKMIRFSEVSRLGFTAGNLLSAGIPIVSVIESLSHITKNYKYQKLYKSLGRRVEEGASFALCFSNDKLSQKTIPAPVRQLIISGEQSGNLVEAFNYVGKSYDKKVKVMSKNLSTLLEPVLLFFVWLAVLSVAIAVILPIYGIVGNFNSNPESVVPPEELPQNIIIDNTSTDVLETQQQ